MVGRDGGPHLRPAARHDAPRPQDVERARLQRRRCRSSSTSAWPACKAPTKPRSKGFSRRTVDYAGLERATGCRQDDPRTDIFFAGTIFYQMLTAAPALPDNRDRAQAGKARYQDIKPILELVPKLPLPLAMVVNKALEFDPEKRYQTPGDMLVDLKLAIKRVKGAKEGRAAGGQELHSSEGLDEQGQPRKLMIVESDVKMQDMLRELFKKNGYRVLVLSDPERGRRSLLPRPESGRHRPVHHQQQRPRRARAFNRFGQEPATRDLPAVLLLDQNHATGKKKPKRATIASSPRCRSRCASSAERWSRRHGRRFRRSVSPKLTILRVPLALPVLFEPHACCLLPD